MLSWVMNMGFAASDTGTAPSNPVSGTSTFLMLGVGALFLVMFV